VVTDGEKDPWTDFLEALTKRPGWTVTRLAKESGVDRSHIYRMMRGETKTVTVETVRMIANGGQVGLAAALHAARTHTLQPTSTVATPPLIDPDDPEIRAIMDSNLTDEKKRDLVAHVRRRKEQTAQQLREEVDLLIESAKRD
jgi:transcriptional regulator with XRE-family HTH domain